MSTGTESYFGMWGIAVLWALLYATFLLFIPFNTRADWKPAGVFLAFAVAFAFEMFGIPFSLYFVLWISGSRLPEGLFWGHTLIGITGELGHYLFIALLLFGGTLVVAGWGRIYRDYWSLEDGHGRLVRKGVYRFLRHPQYTGLLAVSLGALFEWATIPMAILWPILAFQYVRLARSEERDLAAQFGSEWHEYARSAGRFVPRVRRLRR